MWTEDNKAQLVKLWEDYDTPIPAIAEQLGTTRNAVISKAHRLNLLRRDGKQDPRQPPQHVKLRELRQQLRGNEDLPKPRPPKVKLGPTLLELKDGQCKWPLKRHKGNRLFCGEPQAEPDCASSPPYCEAHRTESRGKRS